MTLSYVAQQTLNSKLPAFEIGDDLYRGTAPKFARVALNPKFPAIKTWVKVAKGIPFVKLTA